MRAVLLTLAWHCVLGAPSTHNYHFLMPGNSFHQPFLSMCFPHLLISSFTAVSRITWGSSGASEGISSLFPHHRSHPWPGLGWGMLVCLAHPPASKQHSSTFLGVLTVNNTWNRHQIRQASGVTEKTACSSLKGHSDWRMLVSICSTNLVLTGK